MSNDKDQFFKIIENHRYGNGLPKTSAQLALYVLADYFLGEDWYIVDPVGTEQGNTIIVDEILRIYSKQYIKDLKKRDKERKNDQT